MALKIVKTGNSLVVTDTVTSKDIIDTPARLVYYDVIELEKNSVIRFQNIDQSEQIHFRYPAIPLKDSLDSADAKFTIASFKTFARAELGS